MALKLYMADASPAVRSTLMLAKALNIKIEPVILDMLKGEHLQEEFLKLNPQHTIPTLVDDGHAIWDSHAINLYLLEKHGKETSLYPNDLYKRAIINQRMFFDAERLFPTLRNITFPMFSGQRTDIPEEAKAKVEKVYTLLETFLESGNYMVGNQVTLADISFIPTVTSLNELIPIDAKYAKVRDWLGRFKILPYYSENIQGLTNFRKAMRKIMAKGQ